MPQPTTDKKARVRIFINDDPVFAPTERMTGAEIAALGGVTPGNQLLIDVPGPGEDTPVGPDEVVELRPGMKFYDVPVGTFG